MNPRNLSLTIGEARVIWLALTVFNRETNGDEVVIRRVMDRVEELFNDEEWSVYYERYHGKYIVGVDVGTVRDNDPMICENADEAISALKDQILRYRTLPGVDTAACDSAVMGMDDITSSDVAYGLTITAKYRDDNIRFWLYPDFAKEDLTNEPKSATV